MENRVVVSYARLSYTQRDDWIGRLNLIGDMLLHRYIGFHNIFHN